MVRKKKEASWDEIGKMIKNKIEKESNSECNAWSKSWVHKSEGGGFGRLIFIIGVLFAFSYLGMLEGIPSWVLILIVLGFIGMRF